MNMPDIDIAELEASAGKAAKLLRALANEKRLLILCQLADGERAAGDLLPGTDVSQSALSQHLAVLREQGIVATRREAQTIWYSIADPATMKLVGTLADIFCPKE